MKYIVILLALVSAVAAQTCPPNVQGNCPLPTLPFSITSTALALPGGTTFGGVDAGVSIQPNEYVAVSDHNILSTDGRLKYFGGGIDYFFPSFSLAVNNKTPVMSGFRLLFSLGGSFGESRVSLGSASSVHFAEEFHGAVSYAVTSGGAWQLGVRAGAGRFPYYTKGWIPIISLGPSFHF